MNPRISVIMAVYNGGASLIDSIESILAQSFGDFEFIVVDDGSTDTTSDTLTAYKEKDPRIIVVKNEQNLGLTKSLNKGIQASRGEFVARMDAGDTSQQDRFKKQIQFMDAHRDYGMVGTWAYIIDEQSKKVGVMEYATDYDTLRKVMIRYNPFVHSSVLMRRSVLENAGLYNETWRYAQDYELFFRMMQHGKCGLIGEHLVSYRLYNQSITIRKNKAQTMFAIKARIKAIKEHQYSVWSYIFIVRPLLGYLLPYGLKQKVKSLVS